MHRGGQVLCILVCVLALGMCAITECAVKQKKAPAKAQQIKWPRPVITKARSSSGKLVAVYDSTGYYLADGRGKNARKLDVQVEWDRQDTFVEFSFNKAGTVLAVMAGGWYGEPHVQSAKQLWGVNTSSGKARKVAEYRDHVLGEDRTAEVSQRLGAWSKDGKSIQVIAEVDKVDSPYFHKIGEKKFWVSMAE